MAIVDNVFAHNMHTRLDEHDVIELDSKKKEQIFTYV